MKIFSGLRNKLNTKLLIINLIGIIVMAAVLTVISISMLYSVFQQRYEEKLQTPGRIFLAQYSYKDIIKYVNSLKERPDLLKEEENWLNDIEFIASTEQNLSAAVYPDEYYHAKNRVDSYKSDFSELKDDKYFEINRRMLDLRMGAGLKYFYIFADLGIPDMYTSIFDAAFQGDANISDLGTPRLKSYYSEAEKVFQTGKSVLVLNSSKDGLHDMTYYSFMPITDDGGNVVAVIGTDINMQTLNVQLNYFLILSVSTILFISFMYLGIMYFTLRKLVIKPVQKLTTVSGEIADGNIHTEIPDWIKTRKDEMGVLGKSYEEMITVLHDMVSINEDLFESAISGRLDMRGDPSLFKGFFAQVLSKINDTLDVIKIYFDSLPNCLAILNSEYDIVFANAHFREMFADYKSEVIYGRLLNSNGEEDYASLKQKLTDLLRCGEYSALAWFDIKGENRCLSFMCSRVEHDGNNNGAIIVVSDNTELVRTKDKALAANKAKSEFLSRVSHELRTPLNVIINMAKLGMNDNKLEDSRERHQKIAASSSHLSNIINDVLEMSRMEAGKTEIKPAPMDLREVVKECKELLEDQANQKGIAIVLNIAQDIPETLIGDAFRIKQILINLLSNAVKFTDKGRVTVDITIAERDTETEAKNIQVSFVVADTGIGMSKEFIGKIFMPFEQEDLYLNRRYEGSGLGLSISYNLTLLMNGKMNVTSSPGEGSRFEFIIPLELTDIKENAGENKGEEDLSDDESLKGKRIMLADDIEINRMIVCEFLSDTGIEIDEAEDGKEAYNKFMQSPVGYYDGILMDIQMPKMDGYAASKAIRNSARADSSLPIIAMTANALKEDIENALASGMNDHIAKPVDFDICKNLLKKYLK